MKRQQTTDRGLFFRVLGFEPKPLLVQEFGRISPSGAKQLEVAVIEAFSIYYWNRFRHQLKPPSSNVDHYNRIEAAAERLAHLLAGEPEGRPSEDAAELEALPDRGFGAALCVALLEQAEVSDLAISVLASVRLPPEGAVEAGIVRGKPVGLTHHAALRLATLYLGPLRRAAHMARLEAAADLKPGKGGRRHTGTKATVRLLLELVKVYDQMRRRYPKSGEPLGYSRDGPLERFVQAALACADTDEYPEIRTITSDAIRGAFRRYRAVAISGQI